jgi:hypothetical protein
MKPFVIVTVPVPNGPETNVPLTTLELPTPRMPPVVLSVVEPE